MKQTQQKVEKKNNNNNEKKIKTNMSLSKARKMRESPNLNESLAENLIFYYTEIPSCLKHYLMFRSKAKSIRRHHDPFFVGEQSRDSLFQSP